jgi:hypothetical protein
MANKKKKVKDDRDASTVRLDAIIRLLMDGQRAESREKKITKAEQVEMLHTVGLKDAAIGKIIDQPRNEVAAIRTMLKKRQKK